MSVSRDIKTQGIVLRRTNYGEADRILNIITPEGKLAVTAKGVRKPRSKLAGGVEMFTLSDLQVHMGRGELGVLTSAKMVWHFGEILKDYDKMQLAGTMLKKIGAAAEMVETARFFEITLDVLDGLDNGTDIRLVEAWFWLNLIRASGEEVNLYRDIEGEKLVVEGRYDWDGVGEAFAKREGGEYGADEIKLLRLMVATELKTVKRVKITPEMLEKVLRIARFRAKN